ncbi:hypothetical protein M153_5000031888 [Pseudoloma neurophilia]|uniref:Uncharacterized protein n=1 Tax=Pseudoloma neurophilia TaxID=146866 RepID=A0A0R0M804_9MICR|nr:hypothetical protein M153_5000031888 [Pseudoloma neurophilia]
MYRNTFYKTNLNNFHEQPCVCMRRPFRTFNNTGVQRYIFLCCSIFPILISLLIFLRRFVRIFLLKK